MDGPAATTAPTVDGLPTSELSLLAKLEAANKLIESDAKSLNSLQSSAHSRKSSDTSQISLNSGKTNDIQNIVWVKDDSYCIFFVRYIYWRRGYLVNMGQHRYGLGSRTEEKESSGKGVGT